jgi:endonuclease/exonuclease/phosphatase family metal-dependent hydrolase
MERNTRFGTLNVRSLYSSGSLTTVAKGLTNYKLHLVGVQFVSNRMSYIVLRGRWCNIIVLNVYAPVKEKRQYEELEQVLDHFPQYYTKILLGDFNEILGREDIFKLRIGIESLHQDGNDNDVRIVKFATSKNLVVKSTMFPHRNIHKYTWTSPDGKTHGRVDHILTDGRWHSSIFDVRSFRGVDFGTDHCLVVAKASKD